MTDWTAVAAIVSAVGVLVALGIGIAATVIGIKSAHAAERAAKAAEEQSVVTSGQLTSIYPVLEAYVAPSTTVVWKLEPDTPPSARTVVVATPGPKEAAWVMVRVLHGSIVATDIEAWLCLKGQWLSGRYAALSPNMPLNSAVQIELHQVQASTAAAFSDFAFELGMVGVLWSRPDGQWRYACELGADFAQSSNFVLGKVPAR